MKTNSFIKNMFSRRSACQIIIAICLLAIFGCGGGTDGTGAGSSDRILVKGLLRESSGAPVAGAQVKLQETGNTTTTDTQGNFSLSDDVSANELHIEIIAARFSGNVRVSGIPNNKIKINLQIIFDPVTDSLSVQQSVEIEGDLVVEGGEVTIGQVVIN